MITGLSPATGTAGQSITLIGAGLYSPGSSITAMFGNAAAAVACPTRTTCQLTVPSSPPGSTGVPVTVTTSAGTSNPVTFTYGA